MNLTIMIADNKKGMVINMADILQFARPEEMGVHPGLIADYVREMNARRKMCHSFLMMRHGKVIAEGYWKPFHKDWLHRMYSVSKTFVSAAIGMLCDEGKISLNDKIADYFPDKLPENPHPYIMEMTIRDMLMMATCHKYNTYNGNDMDWLHTFFNPHHEPDHRAGTEFRYDTSGTYTLDVLVERITGKDFLTYLKDKYLREVGFSEDAWCVEAPEGYAWGGSGVECTTRDMARFALLFTQNGVVGGKRYLSEEYVREATSKQIDNAGANGDNGVTGFGYGYKIWRGWHNSYCFLGMGGQLVICIPDRDFVFCCTGDMQGDADGYDVPINHVLWDTVIDKMSDEAVESDDAAYEELGKLLDSIEVNVPAGEKTSPLAEKISGRRYALGENRMGMTGFTVTFEGDGGKVVYETPRGEKEFCFGSGRYEDTFFPETHYSGRRINTPLGREYRCLNAAVWLEENKLLVRSYVIDDYFGNMAAVFTFDEDRVSLDITKTAEWFMDEYPGHAEGKAE